MNRLLPLVFLLSCVPAIPEDGAACPCADDRVCCPLLQICLDPGETCPDTLPSSDAPCDRDADCGSGELCAAWRIDAIDAGPRVCRRACRDNPCDGTERCLLTLHDGRPAEDLSIERLCVNVVPECAAWTCEGCPGLALGELTSCEMGAENVTGCVFAVNATCGLKCELANLGACTGITGPCTDFGCQHCPAPPGETVCESGVLRSCLTSSEGFDSCEGLCLPVDVGSCP